MSKRLAGQMLTGFDDAALEVILAAGRERHFPPGQVLFRTGEPAERLFMLLRGSVRFSRVSDNGREVVMAVLASGDVCGLGSLVTSPMHYYGTAVTLEPSDILVWSQSAVLRLSTIYPRLSQNALHVALNYIAHFIDRQLRLASGTAEQRLAGTLIKLGTKNGHATPTGVELTLTNELLASLADVSPFTTSRAMQNWTRSGAITKSRGRVRITAPEKLLAG
jgi:CRP-like cAMP-binding protein